MCIDAIGDRSFQPSCRAAAANKTLQLTSERRSARCARSYRVRLQLNSDMAALRANVRCTRQGRFGSGGFAAAFYMMPLQVSSGVRRRPTRSSFGLKTWLVVIGFCAAPMLYAQSSPPAAVRRSTQDSTRRVRIVGVFDEQSGAPIEGAEVVDLLSGSLARTTSTGTASLNWLANQHDSAAVQVRKIGYEEKRILVLLGDSADVTVILKRVTDLPGVLITDSITSVVTRMMADFEDRRARGTGKFVTAQQLRAFEARGVSRLTDAMTASGIIPRKYGRECLAGPLTYIDGQVMNRGRLPSDQTSQYDAIEFYAGAAQAPARFSGPTSKCGVLLLYTRK